MDPMAIQVAVAGIVELVMLPVMIFLIEKFVGKRLDKFDNKRDEARAAQAEAESKVIEQREAERSIVLAMARTMLLDNYEKCVAKGFYSLEEREVYHNLYESYRADNGNGVIEELAPRIRKLPIEPPRDRQEF